MSAATAERASHQCPVSRCGVTVPDRFLMCAPHWRMVPAELQSAVWFAYADGAGVGSAELMHAQTAAVAAVERRTR